MRRLALLSLAFALACATVPGHPRERGIPLEVENHAVEDVTVYVTTGTVAWRIGRVSGMATANLEIPRAFEHQVVRTAAKFDGSGRTVYSDRFVLPSEGVTMVVDPRAAWTTGPRS